MIRRLRPRYAGNPHDSGFILCAGCNMLFIHASTHGTDHPRSTTSPHLPGQCRHRLHPRPHPRAPGHSHPTLPHPDTVCTPPAYTGDQGHPTRGDQGHPTRAVQGPPPSSPILLPPPARKRGSKKTRHHAQSGADRIRKKAKRATTYKYQPNCAACTYQ